MRTVKHRMACLFPVLLGWGCIALTGCSPRVSSSDAPRVAVLKFADHPALDHIEEVFVREFSIAQPGIDVKTYCAQGEMLMAHQIAQALQNARPDLIAAIATPSAQACANLIKDVPIIFLAVSDPVAAGIVAHPDAPEGNVTGVSDAMPIRPQLEMIQRLQPECRQLGVLFNPSEANSQAGMARLRPLCAEYGFSLREQAVHSIAEVELAAREVVSQVDAMYMILDNTVASAFPAVLQACQSAEIPLYTADAAFVEHGADASCSVDYTRLAAEGAQMAHQLLSGTPVRLLPVRDAGQPIERIRQRRP
ncbi:MAG: ABC transporter substrate-binding protein [Spartobacteria bacterium]|nr:ABC transporter substrate-binding protein [Spartobacteria bacterium]